METRIPTDAPTVQGARVWLLVAAPATMVLGLWFARAPATPATAGTYELTWPAPKCPPGACDESDVHATLVLLDEKAPARTAVDERSDVCSGHGLTLTGCYISRGSGVHRVNWRNGDRYRPSEVGLSCGRDYRDRLFLFTGDDPRATWRGEGPAGAQGAAVQIKRVGAADPQRCRGPAGEGFTTLRRPPPLLLLLRPQD